MHSVLTEILWRVHASSHHLLLLLLLELRRLVMEIQVGEGAPQLAHVLSVVRLRAVRRARAGGVAVRDLAQPGVVGCTAAAGPGVMLVAGGAVRLRAAMSWKEKGG